MLKAEGLEIDDLYGIFQLRYSTQILWLYDNQALLRNGKVTLSMCIAQKGLNLADDKT